MVLGCFLLALPHEDLLQNGLHLGCCIPFLDGHVYHMFCTLLCEYSTGAMPLPVVIVKREQQLNLRWTLALLKACTTLNVRVTLLHLHWSRTVSTTSLHLIPALSQAHNKQVYLSKAEFFASISQFLRLNSIYCKAFAKMWFIPLVDPAVSVLNILLHQLKIFHHSNTLHRQSLRIVWKLSLLLQDQPCNQLLLQTVASWT